MTHQELITEMARQLGWEYSRVSETMNFAVDVIAEKLCEETQIRIHDFGIFEIETKAEYISVDAQTGQKYLEPPAMVVAFKPSVVLKEQLKIERNHG